MSQKSRKRIELIHSLAEEYARNLKNPRPRSLLQNRGSIAAQYLSVAAVCFELKCVAVVEGCGSHRRRLNFAQSPLEKPTLAVIGNQGEGARVALRRFHCGSDAAQQIGTRRMQ
jgi:hypothetical protein